MTHATSMIETLDAIQTDTTGNEITFGDVVKALNHRGFGSLLIAPAVITALPTGMIPGVPAICGGFVILISLQMLLGKKYPWLPKRLKSVSFSRASYKSSLNKMKPYIKYIDDLSHPRFKFLTHDIAQKLIAVLCIALGAVMIAFGFIPLMPIFLALTILMFGLGLSAHDGLFIALGGLIMLASGSLFFL